MPRPIAWVAEAFAWALTRQSFSDMPRHDPRHITALTVACHEKPKYCTFLDFGHYNVLKAFAASLVETDVVWFVCTSAL